MLLKELPLQNKMEYQVPTLEIAKDDHLSINNFRMRPMAMTP
jgi:hypothetical protein